MAISMYSHFFRYQKVQTNQRYTYSCNSKRLCSSQSLIPTPLHSDSTSGWNLCGDGKVEVSVLLFPRYIHPSPPVLTPGLSLRRRVGESQIWKIKSYGAHVTVHQCWCPPWQNVQTLALSLTKCSPPQPALFLSLQLFFLLTHITGYSTCKSWVFHEASPTDGLALPCQFLVFEDPPSFKVTLFSCTTIH